jgi:hypothetical protein
VTNRERELERALLVIEGLAMDAANDECGHPGRVPAGFTPEKYVLNLQKIASDAYCIAHAASGRCCKGGNGDKWVALTDEREAYLKEKNIIDVQNILDV